MKFFSKLFDSDWRERGDASSRARQGRQHESMAQQVMANRSEILFLQSELDRVSHDLAQTLLLNRALVKLILSQKVCSAEALEETLAQTLRESQQQGAPEATPSRFCEDCGRPLPQPGFGCPYCGEVVVPVAKPKPAKSKKKPKKKKKKSQE